MQTNHLAKGMYLDYDTPKTYILYQNAIDSFIFDHKI